MFPSQLFIFETSIVCNFMSMLVLATKLHPHISENPIRLVHLAGHELQDLGGCNLIGSLRWREYTLGTDKKAFTYAALFVELKYPLFSDAHVANRLIRVMELQPTLWTDVVFKTW